MSKPVVARLAAVCGAILLLIGAAVIWFGTTNEPAVASRAVEPPPNSDVEFESQAYAVPEPAAPKTREEKRFARTDRDDDGRISQAEYLSVRRRNFDKLDSNGDGRLSFEEYAIEGITKFAKADGDGDGVLAPKEFATTAAKPKNPPRQMASVEKCRCEAAEYAEKAQD